MLMHQLEMLRLIGSIVVLFLAASETLTGNCSGEDLSELPDVPINFLNDTGLEIDGQDWQPFFFGPKGTWAVPSNASEAFYLRNSLPVVLRMVDAFRPGDRFALYLNDTFIGNTTLGNPSSASYTMNPTEAFANANYSRGEWIVPSGLHLVTIKVLESVDPSGSGAFIRADINPAVNCGNCRPYCKEGPCKCSTEPGAHDLPGCCANDPSPGPHGPVCVESAGSFVMLKTAMSRDDGIKACKSMDLRLAEITASNFDGANQFALICNGNQVANTWIHSWNGDSYEGSCLVLSSGSFGGTGAITAQNCSSVNHVLCQA